MLGKSGIVMVQQTRPRAFGRVSVSSRGCRSGANKHAAPAESNTSVVFLLCPASALRVSHVSNSQSRVVASSDSVFLPTLVGWLVRAQDERRTLDSTKRSSFGRTSYRRLFVQTLTRRSHIMSSWEIRWSNSRQLPYFYNSSTQESTWESPPGISNDQIKTLPGAHYLNGNQGQAPSGKVRASHLLIKHAQSRRPSSWKEVSFCVLCRVVSP